MNKTLESHEVKHEDLITLMTFEDLYPGLHLPDAYIDIRQDLRVRGVLKETNTVTIKANHVLMILRHWAQVDTTGQITGMLNDAIKNAKKDYVLTPGVSQEKANQR